MIIRANGKVIGELFQKSRLFIKFVKLSKHLFIVHDGWAVDAEVFDKHISKFCDQIIVMESEERKLYRTTVGIFRENAITIHHAKFGRQYCLPRSFWKITDKSKPERVEAKVGGQGNLI